MAGGLKKTPFVNEHWIYKCAIWTGRRAAPHSRRHGHWSDQSKDDNIKELHQKGGCREASSAAAHMFIRTGSSLNMKGTFYTLKENKIKRTNLD